MHSLVKAAMVSLLATTAAGHAQTIIQNPGFEYGFSAWTEIDTSSGVTSISDHSNTGAHSMKITTETGRFEQLVTLHPDSDYELTLFIKGAGTVGIEIGGEDLTVSSEGDGDTWVPVSIPFNSGDATEALIYGVYNGGEGRFDDFDLAALSGPALTAAEAGPPTFTEIPGSCTAMSQLRVNRVFTEGDWDADYVVDNITDADFSPESRWSAEGEGRFVVLDMGLPQTLKEFGIAWYRGDARRSFFTIETSSDGSSWQTAVEQRPSSGTTVTIERYDFNDVIARYVRISGFGNDSNDWNSIVEAQPWGCGFGEIETTGDGSDTPEARGESIYGLATLLPPSENFDLSGWKITLPYDMDSDGRADEISETDLAGGWQDLDVFYTDPVSGGMVFRTTGGGASTPNSRYIRSELRGMLRAGDTSIPTRGDDEADPSRNNWVFSSAPLETQMMAGGVDGVMTATLAVNRVTRMGEPGRVGRVIIGQIHARDDEPIRLYYRRLPFNTHGSIYYAHEPAEGEEVWVELIGGRSSTLENPEDGILLDEVFSYEIAVRGEEIDGVVHPMLHVSITRADGTVVEAEPLDMIDSGFNGPEEFMFFKAGAYSQNDNMEWRDRDYDQVTFFALEANHDAPPVE